MKVILALLMAGIMVAAMIAPAMSEDAQTSASVGNADPVVVSVVVTDPATMNLCPTATDVTVTATVSDANGVGDIASVQITAISPTTGVSLPINMVFSSNINATTDVYTGTISLPCCTSAGDYTVTVTASDGTAIDTGTDILTVPTSTGLSLNFDKVSFSAAAGTNDVAGTVTSGVNPVPTPEVESKGNTAIDISVLASDLAKGGDTITGDNMEANIKALGWQVVNPVHTFDTNLVCLGDASAAFQLDIPGGTPEGSYTGTLTISAV